MSRERERAGERERRRERGGRERGRERERTQNLRIEILGSSLLLQSILAKLHKQHT